MKERRQSWVLYPLDWLLLFAIVYGSVCCLMSSYRFPITEAIWQWCLCLTGLLCILFRLGRGWITGLGGILLLFLGYLFFRKTLNACFWELAYRVMRDLASTYPWLTPFVPAAPELSLTLADLTPAFLMIASALSLMVCASVVWLHTSMPCILWSIACIVPSFLLTNAPPQSIYPLMVLAAALVLVFSQGVRRRAPQEAAKATLLAMIPAAIALGLTLLLFPEKDYKPPIRIDKIQEQFERLGEQMGGSGTQSGTQSRRVDLRSLGQKPQDSRPALTVTVDGQPEGYLYLRAMAYEDFDGSSWTCRTQGTSDGALLTSPLVSGKYAGVTIHTTSRFDTLLTPNYLASAPEHTVFDYYVPNTTQTQDYSFQMYLPVGGYQLAPNPQSLEQQSQDAYANCLALPEDTKAALLEFAQQNIPLPVSYTGAVANAVIEYFRDNGTYNLNPDRVPAGKDFCTWFLTENESGGYCTHFATAATAMLRALGIPARYVEGYITTVRAGEETTVEARQAHAWVEVFLSGEGWKLLDPTPASGVEQTAAPGGEGSEETGEFTETEPDPSGESETVPNPEASEEPLPSGTEQASAATEPTLPSEAPQSENTAPAEPLPAWVWALLGGVCLLAAIWLLRVLRKRNRQAQLDAASGNRLALLLWNRYRTLCRVCRQPTEEALEGLAKKAKFSQHVLKEEELDVLRAALRGREATVRALPLPKRWWCRYWYLV